MNDHEVENGTTEKLKIVVHKDKKMEQLPSMCWQLLTIDERIDRITFKASLETKASSPRIDRWQEMVGSHVDQLFEDRLKYSCADRASASIAASKVPPFEEPIVPKPLCESAWIIDALRAEARYELTESKIASHEPLPFEDLFWNLADRAWDRLSQHRGVESLTAPAKAGLKRILLQRLTKVFSRPLFEHFELFRNFNNGIRSDEHYLEQEQPNPPLRIFTSFIAAVRDKDIETLFEQRPILLRLATDITANWISIVAELISRYREDQNRIAAVMNNGADLGKILQVEGGFSDPHNNGRVVLKLKFECGLEVAYKPKCLNVDVASSSFLSWLETNGAPRSFNVPQTICGDGYGWARWITPRTCNDTGDVEQFFEKAGATLCILMILGGTDFHGENVVADLDGPIAIDLETLFHPWQPELDRGASLGQAPHLAAQRLRRSVISTYYLPSWILRPDDELVRSGGLSFEAVGSVQTTVFENINSDLMRPVQKAPVVETPLNLPQLNGHHCEVTDYISSLKRGFKRMYEFLIKMKDIVGHEHGPLSCFSGLRIRVLKRETRLYYLIVERSIRGDSFSDGFSWSVHFERLSRSFDPRAENGAMEWLIMRSERDSLSQLDIPFFSTLTDSRSLTLPNGSTIDCYYDKSGIDRQLDRIRNLTPEDMEQQLHFIDWTCENAKAYPNSGPHPVAATKDTADGITKDQALQICSQISETLLREAVRGDASLAWIGSVPVVGTENVGHLEVVGQGLYSGSAGIGLFLSAMSAATGDQEIADIATQTLASASLSLDDRSTISDIGGGSGLGSIIYCLTHSAIFLKSDAMLYRAKHLATQITDNAIAVDSKHDLLLGCAGAILGLLALYRASPNEEILDRAIACGRHLAKAQRKAPHGGAAWRAVNGRFPTGMAHGASGVALAMGRLNKIVQLEEFSQVVKLAIEYESVALDFTGRNATSMSMPYDRSSWCSGWSGVGLARLELLDGFGEMAASQLDDALGSVLMAPETSTDDICCGNFGRIDFILTAGLRLGRRELVDTALRMAKGLVGQSLLTGDFRWRVGTKRQNPSFFTGISGVGYQLLRLAAPTSIPSVLIWE